MFGLTNKIILSMDHKQKRCKSLNEAETVGLLASRYGTREWCLRDEFLLLKISIEIVHK